MSEEKKPTSTNRGEIACIGTKIRLTSPDGKIHRFDDYLSAISFVNLTGMPIYEPIGIPDFFKQFIYKELLDEKE
jgi:hypothetical protein